LRRLRPRILKPADLLADEIAEGQTLSFGDRETALSPAAQGRFSGGWYKLCSLHIDLSNAVCC